jgi:peptidoglycan-associated lipoprotein
MKRSTLFSFLLIGLIAFAATGCKKRGVGITPIPGSRSKITGGPGTGPGTGMPYNPGSDVGYSDETGYGLSNRPMNAGPEDRSILSAETIYFDVDSSTIKSSEKAKLERVASYLKSNPSHDVLVEGHCDERGTEGYNQSLGERRALAAREALIEMGAPGSNIFTTSYGESRPAAQGSGDSVWKQNRRGEFVVALPAQ